MKVTLDTIFGEVTEEYPDTERVLKKYLGEAYCLTCPGKMFDTIGNGAMIHGLSDEEAMNMVHDLQEVVDSYDGDEPKEKKEQPRITEKETTDGSEKDVWTALDFQEAFGKDPATGSEVDPETGIDPNADDELDPDEGGSPLW